MIQEHSFQKRLVFDEKELSIVFHAYFILGVNHRDRKYLYHILDERKENVQQTILKIQKVLNGKN